MLKTAGIMSISLLLVCGSNAFAGPEIGKKFKSIAVAKDVTQVITGSHSKADISLGSVVGDVKLGKKFKSVAVAKSVTQVVTGDFNHGRISMGSIVE